MHKYVGDQDSLIKAANEKLTAIYEKKGKRDSGQALKYLLSRSSLMDRDAEQMNFRFLKTRASRKHRSFISREDADA